MMEKLAQAGEGGVCTPSPSFTIFIITYKVAVYAPAECAVTLPLFHLYPYLYSVAPPPPPPFYSWAQVQWLDDDISIRSPSWLFHYKAVVTLNFSNLCSDPTIGRR
jgi:hypothetical protein